MQPDFVAVAEAFGVPARRTSPETLGDDLAWALELGEPAVVVLPGRPRMDLADAVGVSRSA